MYDKLKKLLGVETNRPATSQLQAGRKPQQVQPAIARRQLPTNEQARHPILPMAQAATPLRTRPIYGSAFQANSEEPVAPQAQPFTSSFYSSNIQGDQDYGYVPAQGSQNIAPIQRTTDAYMSQDPYSRYRNIRF